ncbi:EAL domain-containing protein [Parvularcula sp. IMCC14364]|uniref:EAL domain-containing protein n=1 Tax=Parvularcula sp. IMCC14364 TaxID=3067902 RepID=UPI002741F2C6|nr:EAL domain-containing protein [Parvularcula sp. IMCC14364]
MDSILAIAQLGEFFEQARAQAISYPREIMLSEGIILAILGGSLFLFLVIALFRRSGTAATAAGLCGMTAMMEALAFGRVDFLPEGSAVVLQGLFVTTVLLFLTASVRAARNNALLGALMLLAMLGAVGLGVAGFVGALDADGPMRLVIAATAFFATIMVLHQGFGSDKRAMLVAPGVMLASASILAIIIGGNMGVTNWIGAITPHVMLTGGVILAGLMALVPVKADAAAPIAVGGMSRNEPAVAFREDDRALPAGLTDVEDTPLVAPERRAPSVKPSRREPVLATDDADSVETAPMPPQPSREEVKDSETAGKIAQGESPISALWGKRPGEKRAAPVAVASGLAAAGAVAAAAANNPAWQWTAEEGVQASDEVISMFGVNSAEDLSPETMRGLIAHSDLDQYDEAILGGGDPQAGAFDLTVGLHNGAPVRLTGNRELDADGFISRIYAQVEAAGAAPRTMPDDMKQVAAQREAGARKSDMDRLRAALTNAEIRTYFQPIIRVSDEEIIGFEALARWQQPGHPDGMSADQFIHAAVEAGIEADIIRVVAREAAAELASWLQAQPGLGQFVSFNVTADSLLSDELVEIVQAEIRQHRLPKGSLVVELTESHVLKDQDKALSVATALRKAGARLALDDLGSGHSQISRLGKFPFDMIKTDRSLITSLPNNPQAEKLLAGIMDMARRAGAQVVVEGIENQATARLLHDLGCDFAQGFYYGAPEAAGEPDQTSQAIVGDLR